MDIWQILMTPFSWLLKLFCEVFDSYGIALLLFTVVVKVILFPLNLKGKKSMIKMNVVNGQLQEIQKRCGNDKERYNQEVQRFYAENNVNPMGGCGWSMIPLFILWPLYAIIRRPLKYMMNLTEAASGKVAEVLGWTAKMGSEFTPAGTNELTLASMMSAGNLESAKTAATAAGASAAGMFVIDFDFFGIDLSQIPQLKFWEGGMTWASIGLFLLPVISAAFSVLTMLVTQKTNQMNKDQPAPKMNLSLILMGPIMSLWIGFAMPAGMCLYWIANSVLGMVQEIVSGRMLRKDYEAAQKEMEIQAAKAKEAEEGAPPHRRGEEGRRHRRRQGPQEGPPEEEQGGGRRPVRQPGGPAGLCPGEGLRPQPLPRHPLRGSQRPRQARPGGAGGARGGEGRGRDEDRLPGGEGPHRGRAGRRPDPSGGARR